MKQPVHWSQSAVTIYHSSLSRVGQMSYFLYFICKSGRNSSTFLGNAFICLLVKN